LDENGKKKSEEHYKDGKKEGRWTWWYENGQKECEGFYKEAKANGLWTVWSEIGDRIDERDFVDGNEQ
jgi:antitoxin component YwqK of YwqJK toxin-antitoxin module